MLTAANIKQKEGAAAEGAKPKSSAVLTLPAELRVMIYELVLGSEESIDIDVNLREPGLLSVNRQIRNEAREIWYRCNKFYAKIIACDDELMYRFLVHCRGYLGVIPRLELTTDDGKNWANLTVWCKHIWYGISPGIDQDVHYEHSCDTVTAAAHDIAIQHRVEKRSWRSCVQALDNLKMVVQKFDSRWK